MIRKFFGAKCRKVARARSRSFAYFVGVDVPKRVACVERKKSAIFATAVASKVSKNAKRDAQKRKREAPLTTSARARTFDVNAAVRPSSPFVACRPPTAVYDFALSPWIGQTTRRFLVSVSFHRRKQMRAAASNFCGARARAPLLIRRYFFVVLFRRRSKRNVRARAQMDMSQIASERTERASERTERAAAHDDLRVVSRFETRVWITRPNAVKRAE